MRKKMVDRDLPVGGLTRVRDFLPPPHELVFPEDKIRVTLYLRKSSIDVFKRLAKQHRGKYQRIIRELVDRYASYYSGAVSKY